VLASLDGLEHRPVADHVPVFEAAHLRLREALAHPGADPDRDPDRDREPGTG
jgi:hypothetical protein